jgi:hypothetical protein
VRQLVEGERDPRRGEGHATSLTKIRFDDIALATLAKQGLSADAVPAKGTRVVLRNNANLSTGGTATDVTDDVHPEIAARAVAAAHGRPRHLRRRRGVRNVLALRGAGRRHRRSQRRAGPAHAPAAVVRQGPRGGRSHHLHHVHDGDDGRIPVPWPAPTARPPRCA